MKYKSGVGWLPIPVVHGMTLGELALMVNGERWLPASRVCDLTRDSLQELHAPDAVPPAHRPLAPTCPT